MFKLPFFSKKRKEDEIDENANLVAIDIGTELLKTLLFNIGPEGVNIKKVSRIQQQQHAMSKGIINNLNTVLENCRLAINEVCVELSEEEYPSYIVMGLAGEFIQGVSIIVNYEREENFDNEVDVEEQEKIVDKVYDQIMDSGKEDLAQRTGLLNEDIEILHITVTGMEIGGMNVQSLVGYRGKSVKLYFYASFAPKTYIESLRSVADSLEMELLGVVSQPFAVARAFAGSRNKDFSAIFIDIGGGTTDIAVVQKGSVIDTQMFAFGGRAFTKEIEKKMNLDYRHSELRKIKYAENKLDKKINNEVKSIVYPISELWMKSLKVALELVEDTEIFPPEIYLSGGGAMLPDMKNVMLEFPWTKLLPFMKIPKITIFLPQRLGDVKDFSGELTHPYDITPAALTKFAYDKIKNPENYYSSIN